LTRISICGFRGFNDKQDLDLSDSLTIFEGPNGSGKTSIGEAVEWLLYGHTLKRAKGNDLSKREYSGCYHNAHFAGPGLPYVEATLTDLAGNERTIRRELNADETSVLMVDGRTATDLKEFAIDHAHDRPLILQHTLQDFIFMKPKARYEVLSAMLGLEPLIALRTAVETAKSEFNRRIPPRMSQAQSRRILLVAELRQEPILVPVATAIEAGRLAAARQHLEEVAHGLVPSGTKSEDLLNALRATKAAKERAQLDWGRFSAQIIASPASTPMAAKLPDLERHLDAARQGIGRAAEESTSGGEASGRAVDARQKQFFDLGIHLVDDAHPTTCPFCLAETLTAERIATLREVVAADGQGESALRQAHTDLRAFWTAVIALGADVERLLPKQPEKSEADRIRTIAGADAGPFLESSEALTAQRTRLRDALNVLESSYGAVDAALSAGSAVPNGGDLVSSLAAYRAEATSLPAFVNGYAATYNQLDPVIRGRLASAADVKKIDRTISALEHWKDVRVAHVVREHELSFTVLVDEIRGFIKKKQKEVLATRDREIRDWYALLNPASHVGYDGMVPTTDNLELRARTYTKTMFAAPNLSMSQLNCVGLAVYLACATRTGTPFTTLLIDDPVQSMDDDHAEAFKKQVIAKLLDAGFHVVLLTHMHLLAEDVASLYRARGAALFKMGEYSISGPSIDWKGPEIARLLEAVRKNKDGNDAYRKQAMTDLRYFVERFVKDLFKAQTGGTISKRYEDRTWGELRELLRRCKDFEPNDEPTLEDTFNVMSRHLHPDDRVPQPILGSAQITAHYRAMSDLLTKYKPAIGIR
jgi:hypothetical protein